MVYCVLGCGEIKKQKDRNVILMGSKNIIGYVKESSLSAKNGLFSRLTDRWTLSRL